MELTTEYSSWYLIWCAVLAGLYTFLLYGRNKQNLELPQWVVNLLGSFRFITVFILSALLLNPLIQKWVSQTEPPVIIIAQDVSASIINNQDSNYYNAGYIKQIQDLTSELSLNYKVVTMNFGENVSIQDTGIHFTDKRTNYGKVFDEIDARYAGDNIGALIFASDGLFNVGANPEYYNFKEQYPIFTIGLGDTNQKSDIAIVEMLSNEMVYLGNSFPVEVSINAELLSGNEAYLRVFNQGKEIEKRAIKISSNQEFFTERFVFEATNEGTQRYVFKVTAFENELNIINNTSQVLIDVLDNRDKVLIIANAPHPDIAALRSVFLEKESVEVDVVLIEELNQNLETYNLIIGHGFGAGKHSALWNKVWESKIPFWAILYGKSRMKQITGLNPGFDANGDGQKVNRITPSINPSFDDFIVSSETKKYLVNVPPLHSPYAELTGFDDSQVLFYQKLGSVETNYPLGYFNKRDEVKTAWLFGEGLWQWKLYDFQEHNTHDHFNEYVWKTVQYLSVKEDKSRFRIQIKKRFNENQNVVVHAEYYNKSYELINELEVKLSLTDQDDNQYDFVFNNVGKTYALDIGKLRPGVYSYVAKVNSGSNAFSKKGSFIINPINVEWSRVSADYNVLKKLAHKTNGAFFTSHQMDALAAVFADQSAFPSITYTSERKQSILHEKWIFFLILLLLTVEWIMRKYKGRY
jgi:hypothetical protein